MLASSEATMARATPLVSENILTYHTGLEDHTLPIGSPAWWRWLNAEHTTTFRYENARGSFTARREQKKAAGTGTPTARKTANCTKPTSANQKN